MVALDPCPSSMEIRSHKKREKGELWPEEGDTSISTKKVRANLEGGGERLERVDSEFFLK